MTSETWFRGGVDESARVALGASVRQVVADWGGGHLEALLVVRAGRPVVDSAMAYPLTNARFEAASRLQTALDLAI